MQSHPPKFPTTAGCGAALIALLSLSVARGDVDSHAQDDAFAAEAAALLPPAEPVIAAVVAPEDRDTLGDWSAVIPWTPHIPVSAATLPDGRLLTFASNQRTTFPSGSEFTYAAVWNPATGVFTEYNHPSHDMFCGALVTLPDGRVLVNGGRNTTVRSSLFDWRINTWARTPDMNDPRWYNTSVALPNGQVWTVTGDGGSGTAERWDAASGWSRQTGINWNPVLAEPGYITRWHPFVLVAPDGRLIHFGPTDTMHWITPSGGGSMTNTGTIVPGTHYPKEGSWVMYDEGRILVAGGGANTTSSSGGDGTTGTSSKAAYTVDVRSGTPVVVNTASMSNARQFANAVILPNGEVMVMGGNTSGLKFNDTGSVYTPEIWNPTNGTWRIAADASVPRNYHSVALLLPDGRVFSGGGGLSGNSADHRDAQLFTPPQLYNSDGSLATRPILSAAPQKIGVAVRFNVSGTAGLKKFTFLKMSAITHSVNTDLRFLSLPFTETSAGNYELTAHASLNVMTPGYWMLFGLDSGGRYSVARIIQVDSVSAPTVTPPGDQASYQNVSASLQMVGSVPTGSSLAWSATGLPTGLTINATNGLVSGTPATLGSFASKVTLSTGAASNSVNFTWAIQPVTFTQQINSFSNITGLTLNGDAAMTSNVLRVARLANSRTGSAFLSNALTVSSNLSFSTRFVFRIHGTADGDQGLAFVVHGGAATALGSSGSGLGYGGLSTSVAVELDNRQSTGDSNANHLGIVVGGNQQSHLATYTPGWNLEDGLSQTLWVEYDGAVNQLRVFAAQGVVTNRPASPVMTATVDLPAVLGGNPARFGFTGASGSQMNNHDIESWSLMVNALALPAPPVLTKPANTTNVIGTALSRQLQATDPNGDLLTWSASGLPAGLAISGSSGLVTGVPSGAGIFSSTVSVSDGHSTPVSTNFTWTINPLLTIQSLSNSPVSIGTTVPLNVQSTGGLNPQYRWSFGDGTPETAFTNVSAASHSFSAAGRHLVTVTARDDTGREVTASYRQAVYGPLTTNRPTATSSLLYETRTNGNARLWVVNPDNDSVTVFDAITRSKLAEINVGRAPRTIARAPDGRMWVANAESASLTILNTNFTVAQSVTLPRGSRPFGVVFDPAGQYAYVTLETAGWILKLHPTTGAVVAMLDVGPNVRHLSITADSTRLLASRFITPPLPGESTANPQTMIGGTHYGGEVAVIALASFTKTNTVILEHSEEPDTSVSARGIPNYLGAAVISPDGKSAWVPSKQDNIKRGLLRNGGELNHDLSIRSIVSRIDLPTQTGDMDGRVDFDNAGIASSSAFDPLGIFLFTALEGSREVGVVDAVGKQEILRFAAGRAPQALVLSPDGRTLFVHNFMDRTLSVHDLNALANGQGTPPPAPAILSCVTTEKLSPEVLLGKQLFYDAQDNRIALQQYISCAACHNDGGQDGRVWDFTQFGEGLRNTTTLRGHGGTNQGPLHWTGNFDEVQDFEGQIRNFAGGIGLMSDALFHAGTRSQPLGDSKAGLSADLDALAAYLTSLNKNGDSPDRNPDGTFTAAALAGQTVFQQQNCLQCHAGPQFTDSALNVLHNIGTLKPSSGKRLNATLTGLDTPTLRGLWANAPYLHDGTAATLAEAITAHTNVTVSAIEITNLVAFLRQLDDGGSSTPIISSVTNQSTTVNKSIAAIPVTIQDVDTPVFELVLNGGSSNPALVPTNNLVLTGSGTNRTLTLAPAPNQIGSTTITLTLSDGSLTTNVSFVVTVGLGELSVTGITADDKTYDGSTVAELNLGGAQLIGDIVGADVSLNITGANGAFLSPAVGSSGAVQITGLALDGSHAGNYNLTQPVTSANITTRPVLPIVAASNKMYDGNTTASLSLQSVSNTVEGETVTLQVGAAHFDNPQTGTNKTVTVALLGLDGTHAANYTLGVTNATTLASILPALLNVKADDKSRPYGAANPTLTAKITGFVNNESWATAGGIGSPELNTTSVSNSAAGEYPIIVAAGSLTAPNYTFAFADGTLTVLPPGDSVLKAILVLEDHRLQLTGTGDAGVVYAIQTSTDLVHWQSIGTATADANGNFEFEDPTPAQLERCYYRVALP
jgi:YVTN family beta-propeller protein